MRSAGFVAVSSLLFCGGLAAPQKEESSQVFPPNFCVNDTCYELKHVAIVHRHTIRAPDYFPEGDEYLNEEYYPRKKGRATTQGLERALVLGNIIRHWLRNSGFLSGDVNEVYARTSSLPRCFETSLEILKGIFLPGPCTGEECVDFDPVAIFRIPRVHDKNINFCVNRNVTDEMHTVAIPEELQSNCSTLDEFTDYIRETLDLPDVDPENLFLHYLDSYICNDWEHLPIPPFMTENRALWQWASEKYYRNFVYTLGTSAGHGVSDDIVEALQGAKNQTEGESPKKLSILGYHDVTVTALLDSLTQDLETPLPRPSFIGAVFFELLKNEDDYAIRVRRSQGLNYDGGYASLVDLPVSECGGNICTIEQLSGVFKGYFKDDECPTKNVLV